MAWMVRSLVSRLVVDGWLAGWLTGWQGNNRGGRRGSPERGIMVAIDGSEDVDTA